VAHGSAPRAERRPRARRAQFGMFKQQYYMADELADDFVGGGHAVRATVFLTTHAFFDADAEPLMAPLGEVRFVQGVAAQFASGAYGALRVAAAIVGTADLGKYGAAVEPLLLACMAASPNYRGIRCNAAHDGALGKGGSFHPTPGLYAEPRFREGFALLGRHGLLFDAFVFGSQLDDVRGLALAFPDTTIVLDHCGAPLGALGDDVPGAPALAGRRAETVAGWRGAMRRLAAECPNVYVKIGGLVIPQLGHGLERRAVPAGSEEVAALLEELVLWMIETFGAARCMLEGNFPVDKVSCSYTVLWNAYKRITAHLPAADRALLFRDTAKRVYRLG
jgi:L-fuconolactonase